MVPFNLAAAGLVLVGGALGGDTQWVLWALAAALLWVTPWLTSTEGFVIAPEHFVERHALVVIVAAVAALATIPLATQLDAKAQVGALAAIVAVALAVEGARSRQISV